MDGSHLFTQRTMKEFTTIVVILLLIIPVMKGAPSERKDSVEPMRSITEEETERPPVTQKQNPQPPPQITFPFPFFPFRPEASLTPGSPPFTFPFLFPSFISRPSNLARSSHLPLYPETFIISDGEETLRERPTTNRRKSKKKKKKPETPKPMTTYQKENQIFLEEPNFQSGLAGQFANGNQGSYVGYYMAYLVEVRWNGSNQTQTIITGRPVLTTNPSPIESAQMTDLSGALMTEDPLKPTTTQCLLQRSTAVDITIKPLKPTNQPDEEIVVSEEMETGDDYYEGDSNKKNRKKSKPEEGNATII